MVGGWICTSKGERLVTSAMENLLREACAGEDNLFLDVGSNSGFYGRNVARHGCSVAFVKACVQIIRRRPVDGKRSTRQQGQIESRHCAHHSVPKPSSTSTLHLKRDLVVQTARGRLSKHAFVVPGRQRRPGTSRERPQAVLPRSPSSVLASRMANEWGVGCSCWRPDGGNLQLRRCLFLFVFASFFLPRVECKYCVHSPRVLWMPLTGHHCLCRANVLQ